MKALKPIYLFFYRICIFLAETLVRLVYPVRAIGRENLIKDRGFVLAPNHLFAIDPMYILMARGFGKKMLVMGKEELFEISPIVNFLWYCFGAFPVRRGTGDRSAVEQAQQEVKKGRGLLVFPEGTRSKDGNLGRLKSGAFVVALEAGVDILPCRIWYKAGRPKPFRRITVVFGKPVTLEELGLVGEYSPAKLRVAKHRFAEILNALYEENKERL